MFPDTLREQTQFPAISSVVYIYIVMTTFFAMHFTPLRLPLYFVKLVPVISLHVCSFSRSVSSLEWSLLQVPSRSLDAFVVSAVCC